jgi:hypothetical protein
MENLASVMVRWAFFLAVDMHGHFATCMRAAAYLIPYYILATPNALLWQMYLVCAGIVYACTGTGYLLSLVWALQDCARWHVRQCAASA